MASSTAGTALHITTLCSMYYIVIHGHVLVYEQASKLLCFARARPATLALTELRAFVCCTALYSEEEHAQRLSNFKNTLRTVALHNEVHCHHYYYC
jgi:hypothetical protein